MASAGCNISHNAMCLSYYLLTIVLYQEQFLISGDFNIHVDNAEDTDAIKLIDLLESFGLQQHVTCPTHKHAHALVLIITLGSGYLSTAYLKKLETACKVWGI